LFGVGSLLAIACSVWFCGQAEQILGQTDPGSVVLDEIAAMPVCFVGWLILAGWPAGSSAGASLITDGRWRWTLGIYVLFRVFDVLKPWPVKQSQALPGGWGVTADDLLAALYVNVAIALVWWISGLRLTSANPPA
jgi:phosphatidylglycerophosphatase A